MTVKRLAFRPALAFCLALALLACSLPVRAGQPAARPVRVAYLLNDIHHLALWVGLDKEYFRQEGLDVQVVGVFRSGPEIMAAFAAGELDAAYVGEAPATIASARGTAPVKALAQANTEGTALVLASGLDPKDPRPKTLAVPGSGSVQDLLLRRAMAARPEGLGRATVMTLSPPEMITALQAGQIDGFIAWEPYPSRAVALGAGRLFETSSGIWPGHPCCVLAVSEAYLREAPAGAAALARAHERATARINADTDEAVAVAVKFTGMEEAVVREAMGRVRYTSSLSVEGEEDYVRFLTELGLIAALDVKGFVRGFLVGPQAGGR